MPYEQIQIEESHGGAVATLALAVPSPNVLTARMMTEISNAIAELSAPAGRKLIVITGQGRHFSYGASVEEHLPDLVRQMLPQFHALVGRILDCDVPTIAKVSGFCLGGGFELALACGSVFADETAKFGVPEIQLGVFPPVAAVLLPTQVPNGVVSRMILTGERLPASLIAQYGLVTQVSAEGQLDSDLADYIETHLIPRSAMSLRLANRALLAWRRDAYHKYINQVERLYLEELMSTHDAVEGIQAFLQKRKPEWRNA